MRVGLDRENKKYFLQNLTRNSGFDRFCFCHMKGIISGSITAKFTYDILNAMVSIHPFYCLQQMQDRKSNKILQKMDQWSFIT